jgi:hypothetical protein
LSTTLTNSFSTKREKPSQRWTERVEEESMRILISVLASLVTSSIVLPPTSVSQPLPQTAARPDCGCTDDPPFVRNPIQSQPLPADRERLTSELSGSCADAAIASRALGLLADPASVGPLIRALHHSSCRVRAAAADALGQFKDHHAVDPLIGALSDSDARVRSSAAWSLAQLHDETAVPALLIAVTDKEKHVRQAAATALGNIGDARAGPALTRALRDPEKHVRQAAAAGLGKLRRS